MSTSLEVERIFTQRRVFGCTSAALETLVDTRHSRLSLALSMLSDAQELIERGHKEGARQAINRAKYMINAEESGL